jgi:hypothetical protein
LAVTYFSLDFIGRILCMVINIFSIFFLLMLSISTTQAEVYRWLDENGKIQFSDRPSNNRSEKVTLNTERNSYSGGGILERQRDLLDEYRADSLRQERKDRQAAIQKAREKKLQQRCIRAKDRLKNYAGSSLYRLDQDGDRIYYSEEERSMAIDKFKQLIQENC